MFMRRLTMQTVIKICGVVLLVAAICPAAIAQELRLITVSGEGEVKVVPDEVVLTLGVETWNQSLDTATNENDRRVQAVIGAAEDHDIEEKNIQTSKLSIEPRYQNQWDRQEFVGYFVRKTIVITLTDTSKFEALLADVLEAGANYVYGIQFRTSELQKYKDQARIAAIQDARDKASLLAGELNEDIGRPHDIREGSSSSWYWYNESSAALGAARSSESGSAIALGEISITATVTVSFELMDVRRGR
jgi:uncharacterized protein YggE